MVAGVLEKLGVNIGLTTFSKNIHLKKLDLYYYIMKKLFLLLKLWLKKIIDFLDIKPTQEQYKEALSSRENG